MSKIAELAGLIRVHFRDNVTGLSVIHDNVPEPDVPPDGRWARLTIQDGVTQQVAFSGATQVYRTVGVALLQVFEPLGVGDGALRGALGQVQDAFRGVVLAGPPQMRFQSPYLVAPPLREQGWWSVTMAIPFLADEHYNG